MDAPPQYNPPAVVTATSTSASSSAPILFYTHMPAGAYVYNPPVITPLDNGGSSAPVQQGATAIYQEPGAMPMAVHVTIPNAKVVSAAEKSFVVFEIHFHAGDVQHITLKRYSELRKIHDQLVSSAALRECTLPEFPSALWFIDHTEPEHMARRKKELVRYFNALLKEPKVLLFPRFHTLMGLASDVADAMRAVGNDILDARMERQRAEQERQRQAETEQQRKMREAYNHAQTFHRDDHFQVWPNGTRRIRTRALTYTEPTVFHLREKFMGFGDATIQGPNGQPWFQIINISCFPDTQFAIRNMQGEPLVLLQECWKFMSRKYKIYINLNDESGQRGQHVLKMCSIARTSFFGMVEYVIRLATYSTARDARPCRKSLIKCDGSWGDWNTRFSVGGRETARVGRNFTLLSTGDYDIHVSPHQDVILYLALAVCIDKMHRNRK